MLRIRVQEEDFDAGAELAALAADGVGGIASFIGTVRDAGVPNDATRSLAALHLEHYPEMTERAMQRIAGEAMTKWNLIHCSIVHRIGRLLPRQNIVFVGASSPHRAAALEATSFLIDWLKTSAPIWKREDFCSGESAWVSTRSSDDAAASRWKI